MQQPVVRIGSWQTIKATTVNELDGDRLHKGTAFWPDKMAAGVTISISLSLNRRSKASLVLISVAVSDGFICANAAGNKGACQTSSGCTND